MTNEISERNTLVNSSYTNLHNDKLEVSTLRYVLEASSLSHYKLEVSTLWYDKLEVSTLRYDKLEVSTVLVVR